MRAGRAPAVLALASLLAVIAAIVAFVERGAPARQAALPQVEDAPGFPRRVRLWDGRELTLPAPPRRIVPANAGATDFLIALVEPERIAALPRNALADSLAAEDPAAWRGTPTFVRFTAEPILALEPDLVLCDPFAAAETLVALRKAGVPVVTVPDPRSWEDVLAALPVVARLVGAEERADALLADLRRRAEALAADAGARSGLSVMSYTNFGSGGWTAGSGTTVDAILGLAGARNAAAEAGISDHQPIDFERLLSLQPDVLLVGAATDSGSQSVSGALARLRAEPALGELDALRRGAVVVLPAPLFGTTSHRLLAAAEALAVRLDALSAPRDSPSR